jgi:hypothetical protein
MHKELDMAHGQGSDKLCVGVLPDMLKVMGVNKPKRQRMATVVALEEHNGPPSCSAVDIRKLMRQ